jgi:hypothetical protein
MMKAIRAIAAENPRQANALRPGPEQRKLLKIEQLQDPFGEELARPANFDRRIRA